MYRLSTPIATEGPLQSRQAIKVAEQADVEATRRAKQANNTNVEAVTAQTNIEATRSVANDTGIEASTARGIQKQTVKAALLAALPKATDTEPTVSRRNGAGQINNTRSEERPTLEGCQNKDCYSKFACSTSEGLRRRTQRKSGAQEGIEATPNARQTTRVLKLQRQEGS